MIRKQSDLFGITDLSFVFRWKNSGTTPTKGLFTYISALLGPEEMPDNFPFPDLDDLENRPAFIGPKAWTEMSIKKFSLENIESVWSGTNKMYCWGWAEYYDVFEDTKRHRFEFCYEMFFIGENFPQDVRLIHSLHTTHNGEDDECLKPVQTSWPK